MYSNPFSDVSYGNLEYLHWHLLLKTSEYAMSNVDHRAALWKKRKRCAWFFVAQKEESFIVFPRNFTFEAENSRIDRLQCTRQMRSRLHPSSLMVVSNLISPKGRRQIEIGGDPHYPPQFCVNCWQILSFCKLKPGPLPWKDRGTVSFARFCLHNLLTVGAPLRCGVFSEFRRHVC